MKKILVLGLICFIAIGSVGSTAPMALAADDAVDDRIERIRDTIRQIRDYLDDADGIPDSIKTQQREQLNQLRDAVDELERNAPDFSDRASRRTFLNNLNEGDSHEHILIVQNILSTDPRIYPEGLLTGYFGPLTTQALQRFQQTFDFETQNGRLNLETRRALEYVLDGNIYNFVDRDLLRQSRIRTALETRDFTSASSAAAPSTAIPPGSYNVSEVMPVLVPPPSSVGEEIERIVVRPGFGSLSMTINMTGRKREELRVIEQLESMGRIDEYKYYITYTWYENGEAVRTDKNNVGIELSDIQRALRWYLDGSATQATRLTNYLLQNSGSTSPLDEELTIAAIAQGRIEDESDIARIIEFVIPEPVEAEWVPTCGEC